MKILPTNNFNSNQSFKGLWAEIRHYAGSDDFTTYWEQENRYFPFADESRYEIETALERKTFEVSYPSPNDFQSEHLTAKGKLMEKLPFTRDEFRSYKKFYGDIKTESVKKVEQGLKEFKLFGYLNGGKWYSFKQFLHRLKLI